MGKLNRAWRGFKLSPVGAPGKAQFLGDCLKSRPRTFWMTPKLSSIVILNLIAKVRFLYHKPKDTRILH